MKSSITAVAAACALAFAAGAATDRTIVVLPLDVTKTDGKMTDAARATLEEQLRDEAANALAGSGFTVMTGETTLKLLEDNGIDPAKCGQGSCHLDTAKEMHVGKFISGAVQFAEGVYTASVRLIDTKTGNILASATLESETVRGMRAEFRKKAPAFFARSGLTERRRDAVIDEREERIGGAGAEAGGATPDEFVVRFSSEPPGAVVLADGRMLCQSTPCSRTLGAGEHQFAFEKEGYDPFSTRAEVKRGASVEAKLQRIAAMLAVVTQPAGLLVQIDGQAVQSPATPRQLPPGRHEVVVADPCWIREGERIVLKRGEDRTVRIAPRQKTASVRITAEDERGNALEGEAEVDGKPLGQVPGTHRIPVCAKDLRVKSGTLAATQALALRDKPPAELALRLRPSSPAPGARRFEPKSELAFVFHPPGSFRFGCEPQDTQCEKIESPARAESVAGFWLSRTETTVRAYRRCTLGGGCVQPPQGPNCNFRGAAALPINCVSWEDAVAFCRWIGGRLPTAVEWEYAAKGGESRIYPWGDAPVTKERAWYDAKGQGTRQVGSFPSGASKWDVLDLIGNVWEFTSSEFGDGHEKRGAGWYGLAPGMRNSRRWGSKKPERDDDIGFRCAMDER